MSAYNKLLKFGVVGVFATLTHVVIASWLIESAVQSPVPLANIVAFLVATTFSYICNTKWSFAQSFNRSNGTRFAVTASVGCVLAFFISWLAEIAGFHYLVGIALIVVVLPGLTFLSHFFWTFRSN